MKIRTKKPAPTVPRDTSLDSFLNHSGKPEGTGTRAKKLLPIEVAIDEAADRNRRGEQGGWDGASGRAFVGLYAMCFKLLYGEVPLDLKQRGEFAIAARMATRCLHEFFDDDPGSLVEYVRWCWEREKRVFAWKLQNGADRKPMGARLQFAASLVQTYRVELRTGKGRRGR